MDGLKGELEGTLARTAQKKQTALNRYDRFKRDQEKVKKFGFSTRPSSTAEVADLKAAEHFYREVRTEFSNKLSRMNTHVSIEGNGTAEVRVINDELNSLVREMQRWSNRVGSLGGNPPQPNSSSHTFRYYGPAKDLPEAADHTQVGDKRSREQDEDLEAEVDLSEEEADPTPAMAASSSHIKTQYAEFVMSRLPPTFILSDAEEKSLRKEEALLYVKASAGLGQRTAIPGYFIGSEGVPPEDSVWQAVTARRKAALLARIKK